MRSIAFSLFLFLSASGFAQQIDIYSKWTAFPDEKTQIIMDLSDTKRIYVKRIQLIERDRYRIDSFGYKRACSMIVRDLGSSAVFWVAGFERLHPNISENQYVGEFYVTERNWNGTPVRMKMSDEIPDLAIDFFVGDSLEFIRMITNDPDELTKQYQTFYGGRIEETAYYGENSGTSGGMTGIGMRYSKVSVDPKLKKILLEKLTSIVNNIRKEHGVDILFHDIKLDDASSSDLNNWINGMNITHQIKVEEHQDLGIGDNIDNDFKDDQYGFEHYPFRCGKNMLLISSTGNFSHKKKTVLHYLENNQDLVVKNIILAMLQKRGSKQNILNTGYSTVGFDIQLVKGTLDDFYFDENGKRIVIKRLKIPYYYLMVAQVFSIYE